MSCLFVVEIQWFFMCSGYETLIRCDIYKNHPKSVCSLCTLLAMSFHIFASFPCVHCYTEMLRVVAVFLIAPKIVSWTYFCVSTHYYHEVWWLRTIMLHLWLFPGVGKLFMVLLIAYINSIKSINQALRRTDTRWFCGPHQCADYIL